MENKIINEWLARNTMRWVTSYTDMQYWSVCKNMGYVAEFIRVAKKNAWSPMTKYEHAKMCLDMWLRNDNTTRKIIMTYIVDRDDDNKEKWCADLYRYPGEQFEFISRAIGNDIAEVISIAIYNAGNNIKW